MQPNSLDTKPSNRVGTDEDALPGFASSTPHGALLASRAADATRLKALASDAIGTVRDMAREARTSAVEHIGATAARVGNTAREQPFRTLGIALAVGAVIGLLLSRR